MGATFSRLALSTTLLGLLARGVHRGEGRAEASALALQLCGQRGRRRRAGRRAEAYGGRTTRRTATSGGTTRRTTPGGTPLMRGAFIFKGNAHHSWCISRGTPNALGWSTPPVRRRFFAKVRGGSGSQGGGHDGAHPGGAPNESASVAPHPGGAPHESASVAPHPGGASNEGTSSELLPGEASNERTGRTKIKDILRAQGTHSEGETCTICGWVKSVRTVGKNRFSFIDVNDGSHVKNLQVVVDAGIPNYGEVSRVLTDDAVECSGELKCSLGKKQRVELCVRDAARAHYVRLLGRGEGARSGGGSEGGSADGEGEKRDDGEGDRRDDGEGDRRDDGEGDRRGKHYAIAKKYHSKEHLRSFPHLRARTKLYSCVFRLKSDVVAETFKFWRERNCTYINTPVLTSNDCEGAGELFHATTLMSRRGSGGGGEANGSDGSGGASGIDQRDERPGEPVKGDPPFCRDFFKKPCYLNVSSQLALECLCCSMGDVFTLNQSFRAEQSNTVRHLSEFLMMEVELAFSNLTSIISLAEEYIKTMVKFALHQSEDVDYIHEHHDRTLKEKLQAVLQKPFAVVTYDEAMQIVKRHVGRVGVAVDPHVAARTDVSQRGGAPPPRADLTFEEQRFLTEVHFRSPVVVVNYPQEIKPFYMALNADGKTVACMDVLLPHVGEVVGGSEREIRIHTLERRMKEKRLDLRLYEPYLQLRRQGNVPHAGFGLGVDRLIMFLTSMSNIRDVVPFPRAPGSLFM
ncbi:asparagine--tRNA ligase, putative [Plasmodium vivax]|nr:asparagine--tRNA ligase, putative [Plasmodium vivax]